MLVRAWVLWSRGFAFLATMIQESWESTSTWSLAGSDRKRLSNLKQRSKNGDETEAELWLTCPMSRTRMIGDQDARGVGEVLDPSK